MPLQNVAVTAPTAQPTHGLTRGHGFAASIRVLKHLRSGASGQRRHFGKRFFRIAVWTWIAAFRLRRGVVELSDKEVRVAMDAYTFHNASASLANTRQALSALGFITTDAETRRLAKQTPIPFGEFALVLLGRKRLYVYEQRDTKRGKVRPPPSEICELFALAQNRDVVSGAAIAEALRTFGVSPTTIFAPTDAGRGGATSPLRDLTFAELNAVVSQQAVALGAGGVDMDRLSPSALFKELDIPDWESQTRQNKFDRVAGLSTRPTRNSMHMLSSDDDSSFDFGGHYSSSPAKGGAHNHGAGSHALKGSATKSFFRRGNVEKSKSGATVEPKRRRASLARGLVASRDVAMSRSEATFESGPDWGVELFDYGDDASHHDSPHHRPATLTASTTGAVQFAPSRTPRRSFSAPDDTLAPPPVTPPHAKIGLAPRATESPADVNAPAESALVNFVDADAHAPLIVRPWSRESALAAFRESRGEGATYGSRPISREAERAFVERMAQDVSARKDALIAKQKERKTARHFSLSLVHGAHTCLSPIERSADVAPLKKFLKADATTLVSPLRPVSPTGPISKAQRAAAVTHSVAPRPAFDTRWVPPTPPSKRSQLAVEVTVQRSLTPSTVAPSPTFQRPASATDGSATQASVCLSTWLQGGLYVAKSAAAVPRLSKRPKSPLLLPPPQSSVAAPSRNGS